jgi:hypothetical protein
MDISSKKITLLILFILTITFVFSCLLMQQTANNKNRHTTKTFLIDSIYLKKSIDSINLKKVEWSKSTNGLNSL